jgi:hypothetical protein
VAYDRKFPTHSGAPAITRPIRNGS